MPTAETVRAFQALRARFLTALWDDEDAGKAESDVRGVLAGIDAAGLSGASEARLVRSLIDDHLIEDARPLFAPSPIQVRLTAAGRAEVEHWTTEPDEPTPHLPVTHQTVFNTTFNGPVHGSSLVQGSHDVQVTMNGPAVADLLRQFTDAYRPLLRDLDPGVREAAEADLDTLAEQAEAAEPKPGRVRPLLKRLTGWAGGVAASATTSAASSGAQAEMERLGHQLLSLLP